MAVEYEKSSLDDFDLKMTALRPDEYDGDEVEDEELYIENNIYFP